MTAQQIRDWRNNLLKHPEYDPVRVVRGDMFQLLDAAEDAAKAQQESIEWEADYVEEMQKVAAMQEKLRVLADEIAELLKGMQSVFITAGLEDAKEFMQTETVKALQSDLTCRSEQYRQAVALIQVQREEIARLRDALKGIARRQETCKEPTCCGMCGIARQTLQKHAGHPHPAGPCGSHIGENK